MSARSARRAAARRPDAIELAIVRGLFSACAEEMGASLMRSAHSPNITERLDHSCAVFDARARLVAQAAHIPVHLGSMPRAVEAALAVGPLRPGDVVLLNDPFEGGTHLPDLTLVSPVFLPGRRAPSFLVASRAHHADVGGSAPGSLPIASEVYEEGLRIPPVFVRRGGRDVPDVLRLLLANVRTPHERRADLAAQLGAQVTGERRLRELAVRRGARALEDAAAALLDATERHARAAIARLPRGRFTFEDVLDDDGRGHGPLTVRVALTIGNGRVVADFTGTDPQTAGPVNAVRAVTTAAVLYATRCVLAEDVAVNDGLLRAIRIVTPRASLVDAVSPAAVGAGNVETSQRIVDVVLGAYARALPDRVPAASAGTMNNLLIGGYDPRRGRAFAYYETLGSGHGGGPEGPGEDAMQAHMTNTRNTPVESLEHAYPLEVVSTRIRRGSGGRGRARGGDGIERRVRLLVPARVTVLAERRRRGPWGLAGGDAGSSGVNRIEVAGRTRTMPGKFTADLPAGAVVSVASPGGGGFGAPRRARRRRP